jgi:DNA-binding CsgD family transcriptional regulator
LDSAAQYYKKRIKLNESEKNIEYATSLNNYGIFLYCKRKDKKAALGYFQKAYQITKEKSPRHYLLPSIRDNIADVYRDLGKIKEANERYEENVRYFSNSKNNKGEYEDVPRLVSAGRQCMETYFELNETAKGIRDFKKLEILLKGVQLPPEAKLEYLKTKQSYFEQVNNIAEANSLGKQILSLSDSIKEDKMDKSRKTLEAMSSLTINKVQLKHELERAEKENTIKSQQFIIWIVLLTAFIIAGTLFYLYKTKQQRNINLQNEQLLSKQVIEITALKNKQLESEIESKKRDLTDFAINLSQTMEWAQEFKQKIEEKKLGISPEEKKLLAELEQEIDVKLKFDENNQDFLQRLDALSGSFYTQLKIRYPYLTKTELRLCSLIRLKLEPQQIANLQNISLPSIHTARYRLRKKMNLPESVNLDQTIQEL